MPSNQDPASVVNPGPGRLPAGVVPAGALLPPGGGGGGGAFAALQAHIHNPVDAHLAHAIGIDPYYPYNVPPPTPDPILTSVGGPVDGESVLDFIDEFKDLIPPHPNYLGFDLPTFITNGIPSWDVLNANGVGTGTAETGGYAVGANVTFSHFVVPAGSTLFQLSGTLFPADRGILTLYKNTSGNFTDSAHTTLVAALWLGDITPFPPPVGVPNSAFSENNRRTQQANYTASGAGLDQISLTFRYPYLANYTGYTPPPVPYGPFPTNFFRFQLANFSITAQAVGAGDNQSFLLIHWRESYATHLTSIQPTNLTLPPTPNAKIVPLNCYSAVPTTNTEYAAGSWDDNTIGAYNINRHNVFLDTDSALLPGGVLLTNTVNGSPTTVPLSGVQFYSVASGAGALTWNVDIQASSLFGGTGGGFQTGSVNTAPIPNNFESAFDPIQIDFTLFGGHIMPVPFYVMNKQGTPLPLYSATNAPQPTDVGEYTNATLAVFGPLVPSSPSIGPLATQRGFSPIMADLHTTFNSHVYQPGPDYLWNSFPQAPGAGFAPTTTSEFFEDEYYRYQVSFNPKGAGPFPLVPSTAFASATVFVTGTAPAGNVTPQQNDAQVIGSALIYPQVNYSTGFFPAGPNYAALGDSGSNLRRYMRAFDTGLPRNTGILKIYGLAYAAFQVNAPYNGSETTGHVTGGAIIQILVPGASGTGWLDLGRAYGDPGVASLDFYGCSTQVTTGSDALGTYVQVTYNTSAFTFNNGSGQFPLFVRVTYLNNVAGLADYVTAIEWVAP